MKTIGSILLAAGLVFSPDLLHAQTVSVGSFNSDLGPVQTAQPDSIVQITAEAEGLSQVDPTTLPLFASCWWTVYPGTGPLPMPCPPQDLSVPIYQIVDGYYLVDETGGAVSANVSQTGTRAMTSSAVASAVDRQGNEIANLIEQVQATAANQQTRMMARAMGMDVPSPGGGDGGGSYSPDGITNSYVAPDYGTNLWIAQTAVAAGNLTGIGSNTIADVQYEIQSRTNLMQTDWQSEGFITGSEVTNWTPLSVAQNGRTNLFIRLRSWIDSDNVGIPDWWQLEYFGYVGIDPNAPAPAGDGYSNLQKYLLGLNPNVFSPPAINNFIAVLGTNGTRVILSWTPGFGTVQHYAIGRYDFNWNTYDYDFTPIGQVSSNTVSFVDSSDTNVINGDIYDTYYQIQAIYTNGATPAAYAYWIQSSPPAPQGLTVNYNNGTGAVTLNWQPSPGAVTGYTVLRQNSPTSGFSTIATVFANPTSYTDNSYPGGNSVEYEIEANYDEGISPASDSENPLITPNYTVPAYIVRGPSGLPYLTVAGIPQNVTKFRIYRVSTGAAYYPISSYLPQELLSSGVGSGYFDIPATNLANGAVYQLNSTQAPPYGTYQFLIQALGADGLGGEIVTNVSVTGDTNRADYNISFHDGRAQIAQNINFLLRETQTNSPFNVGSGSSGAPGYSFSADSSYVFAGFHLCNNNNSSPLTLNEFQPFEENNYYKNYCYSTANVDTNGNLNTGVSDSIAYGIPWHWPYFAGLGTYNFDTYGYVSGASSPSFSTVLDSTTTQWQLLAANSYFVSLVFGYTYYIPNTKNVYGLSLISIKWPGWTTPPTFPTSSPGTALTNTSGAWFMQYDQPTLSSNSYYFARHYIDPLPGESGFSVTNTTPVIFTSVGQPFNITAWAKQSLANGYSGKFAYAEQYFDKAYLADSNGNITTNQTGILSEYGEFFPTQPGTVILTTKADGALGTVGQCKVNVVGLNVDANHDGKMDLTFSGQDQTLPSKPYIFWANNNYDRLLLDKDDNSFYDDDALNTSQAATCPYTPNTPTPDCNYLDGAGHRVIPCERDLQDFFRLWVCGIDTNLIAKLPAGSTVTLNWGDVGSPNTGNPTIDIFTAADPDGGIGYLTNSSTADSQIDSLYCPYIGRLAPGGSIQLNAATFANHWAGSHFIMCGVSNGTGGLNLTIADASGNVLAQSTTYLQIMDIKQMYERWTIGDQPSRAPLTNAVPATEDLPAGASAFQYTQPQDTNTSYILYVHGWNMSRYDKDRFAEAAFKRLYWQGYHGRFGSFRWPTDYDFNATLMDALFQPHNYDGSEYTAWLSAAGLLNKLKNLNSQYPGHVYVLAHSMGNVVTGEALRQAAQQGLGQIVNTYVASQAAIPAHVYDATVTSPYLIDYTHKNPSYPFSAPGHPKTPNIYGNRLTNNIAAVGHRISFYNANDYALSPDAWCFDQELKPDTFIGGYYYYAGSTNDAAPWNNFEFILLSGDPPLNLDIVNNLNDRYEALAYAANPYSRALGSTPIGTFTRGVDLSQIWPSDTVHPTHPFDEHFYHSAQFRGDYWQQQGYWSELLGSDAFNLK